MVRMVLISLVLTVLALPQGSVSPEGAHDWIIQLRTYVEKRYPDAQMEDLLYVSVPQQRLYWLRDWTLRRSFTISTSKRGTGNVLHSLRTPLGLHQICERRGKGVPKGGILKGRIYTGRVAEIFSDETDLDSDDVTSRILRLCGLEPGVNQGGDIDTYRREVYIHGTPEEGLLGMPASNGCVRMSNDEVIELFEEMSVGVPVLILDQQWGEADSPPEAPSARPPRAGRQP